MSKITGGRGIVKCRRLDDPYESVDVSESAESGGRMS